MKRLILFLVVLFANSLIYSQIINKQQLDSIINLQWNANDNQWINLNKTFYTYNDSAKLLEEINFIWNNNWQYSTKVNYEYDNDTNLINKITYLWINGSWVGSSKINYSYTQLNEPLVIVTYKWENNSWKDTLKEEYTYSNTPNNVLLEKISYVYENNSWKNLSKYEYSYDSYGNLILEIFYYWDNANWVNSTKKEYAYDLDNKLIYTIYYEYLFSWAPITKVEYSYDSSNNLIATITYNWISNWENYWKTEYSYNNYGDMVQYMTYSWNSQSNSWVQGYKIMRTYDNNYTFDDMVLPISINYDLFSHKLLNEISYQWNNNLWVNNTNIQYYYSNFNNLAISELNTINFRLYPNPANDFIYIDLIDSYSDNVSFKLYNLLGNEILNTKLIKNNKIDITGLNTGIYIYLVIYNNKKIINGKLLKN